jgi:hypothetical protein
MPSISGYVAPQMVGIVRDYTGSYEVQMPLAVSLRPSAASTGPVRIMSPDRRCQHKQARHHHDQMGWRFRCPRTAMNSPVPSAAGHPTVSS